MLPLYTKNPGKILLSSLTCSQIWLNPSVNDHLPTYLTNLRKTNPNKMEQKNCDHGLNKLLEKKMCVCVCVCVCVPQDRKFVGKKVVEL
jgi:hypothetical protein